MAFFPSPPVRLAGGGEIGKVDGAVTGKSIEIVIPEISLNALARVVSVEDCPEIQAGPGEVVTGTYRTNRASVIDLKFRGISEVIGTTASHPFWSDTKQEFVEAGKLELNEQVLAFSGDVVRLENVTPRKDLQVVYNFEVANEHVYFVTRNGVLVHNAVYLVDAEGWLVSKSSSFLDTMVKAKYMDAVGKKHGNVSELRRLFDNPHGHHIVMKGAFTGKTQKAFRKPVKESQDILHEAFQYTRRQNSINDIRNFAVAQNGNHTVEYAKSVANRLRKAKADSIKKGTSLESEVTKALHSIRKHLQDPNKGPYTYGL